MGRLLQQRPALAGALLASAVLAGARLALTWLIKEFSDAVLAGRSADLVTGELPLAAALAAVLVVAIYASQLLPSLVDQRLMEGLRNDAAGRLLNAPPPVLAACPSGDLAARLYHDVARLEGLTLRTVQQLVSPALILAGTLVSMFLLDRVLAAWLTLGVPLAAAIMLGLGRFIRGSARSAQRRAGLSSGRLVEQIQALRTIRVSGTEGDESARFREDNAAYRRSRLRAAAWSSGLMALVWLVAILAFLVALWLGGERVADGSLSAGGLLAFCLFAGQAVDALRMIGGYHGQHEQTVAAAERVFAILDLPAEPEAPSGAAGSEGPAFAASSRPRGARVECSGLTFAYPGGTSVLDGFDLVLEPGTATALVAASGGGKTTLVDLLLGLRRPGAGSLRLDGREIAAIAPAELYRRLAVAPQEPFLFARSLRENLGYGSRPSHTELEQVLDTVGLTDWVDGLPRGLETGVTELGTSLSGGQRQRISLARLLLRDPALAILDEATSALDGEAEARLFERLRDWLAARTVLVTAHRLATVRRLPRVVVLRNGRVLEDGSPTRVLRSPGARALFADQLAAEGPGAPAAVWPRGGGRRTGTS